MTFTVLSLVYNENEQGMNKSLASTRVGVHLMSKHLHMLNKLLIVLKEEIDSNTIVTAGLDTPLGQWTNLPDRKISKEPLVLH